ncbi:group-specific protein [Bacillus sp. S/N-304-OC-R1]|uniref:group-specific protein n=1 Tax=Bacillus sp. S/N-304-OC-R1 TaxID=2758034 RepID=UPI001C8D0F93|nr:group-specific protein [Bacillus sp. S/N-304-OC-R1]MBY0121175.1 group-specific protein [Bacillus sp. S/N-304-OC-R1]
MGIGFIISLIVSGVFITVIMLIVIPMDRKYIVRENRKINFQKSKILFRWNVFDTISVSIAIYAIICIQILNFLISGGETIENPYVQFFTNQGQAWVIVGSLYLISRISLVLKGLKEISKDEG